MNIYNIIICYLLPHIILLFIHHLVFVLFFFNFGIPFISQEGQATNVKLKSINFHGALLLKTLFDFQNPSKLVKSLLSLSLEKILTLSNDPVGSYAVEAFLKSRTVTSEDKHMLIEKLKVNT